MTKIKYFIQAMVIKLGGVQFGLNSHTSFEITSMISDRDCKDQKDIQFKSTNFKHQNTGFQALQIHQCSSKETVTKMV